MNSKQFLVFGTPATFATKGEVPWKNTLKRSIPAPPIKEFNGVKLKFVLPTLTPNNRPPDIDNLCEPVFSVLINKLGWFDGGRQNLKWWHAIRICGKRVHKCSITRLGWRIIMECDYPSGLDLSIEATIPPEMTGEYGSPFFDETYKGVLPSKATDPQIPSWLGSFKKFKSPKNNDRFVIKLQFGWGKLNIGNIATGPVKSLVDCLYPVIGGSKGKPEDWRVDILQVEKGVTNLKNGSVKISIWKKR